QTWDLNPHLRWLLRDAAHRVKCASPRARAGLDNGAAAPRWPVHRAQLEDSDGRSLFEKPWSVVPPRRRHRVNRSDHQESGLRLSGATRMLADMTKASTALVKQDGEWWIGWIEEVPGVNAQGKTHDELFTNLRSALQEALEMNRKEALAAAKSDFKEELIQV